MYENFKFVTFNKYVKVMEYNFRSEFSGGVNSMANIEIYKGIFYRFDFRSDATCCNESKRNTQSHTGRNGQGMAIGEITDLPKMA